MSNKKRWLVVVLVSLTFFASATDIALSQKKESYRYEITVEKPKGKNIMIIKTDAFNFKRTTSAVMSYHKDDGQSPVDCVDEILLSVGTAIKVSSDGIEETISNSTIKILSPYYIRLVDFNALFERGYRGILHTALYYPFSLSEACLEKRY